MSPHFKPNQFKGRRRILIKWDNGTRMFRDGEPCPCCHRIRQVFIPHAGKWHWLCCGRMVLESAS